MTRSALEDVDRVDRFALTERHDRLFPMRLATGRLPHALRLAALVRRPHAGHVHLEQLLNRVPDVGLRRIRVNLERVLAALLIRRRTFLGDEGANDGVVECRHRLLPPLLWLGRRLLRRGLPGWLCGGLLRRLRRTLLF